MTNLLPTDDLPAKALVLVAEDDAIVRLIAVQFLTDAGFAVLEAENADTAREIIISRDNIDLVFSDIHMPGSMDGEALAAWLAQYRPELPVLLTSGRARPRGNSDSRHAFLPKPYALEELEKQIRELIH